MSQTQEQQVSEFWIFRALRWAIGVNGVAILLAIVGVVLGAMNYMGGPIHYLVVILAGWMVVDILLLVILLLHLVLYGLLTDKYADTETENVVMPSLMIAGAVFLIAGGIMLLGKHLAWVSVFELFFLAAATVINVIVLIHEKDL